jgi:hypothetical protein
MTDAAFRALASHGRAVVIAAADIPEAQRDHLESLGLIVVDADPLQPATNEIAASDGCNGAVSGGG